MAINVISKYLDLVNLQMAAEAFFIDEDAGELPLADGISAKPSFTVVEQLNRRKAT